MRFFVFLFAFILIHGNLFAAETRWQTDMDTNTVQYHLSWKDGVKYVYDPIKKMAFVNNGGLITNCGVVRINDGRVSCIAAGNVLFNVPSTNLQASSEAIRKVVSGKYIWLYWMDRDPFTVEYVKDKKLTFDKATMRFQYDGVTCHAIINGTPWVYVNQLKYDRVSLDQYSWNLVMNPKSLLVCSGVRAVLSGLYKNIECLDTRSKFQKEHSL